MVAKNGQFLATVAKKDTKNGGNGGKNGKNGNQTVPNSTLPKVRYCTLPFFSVFQQEPLKVFNSMEIDFRKLNLFSQFQWESRKSITKLYFKKIEYEHDCFYKKHSKCWSSPSFPAILFCRKTRKLEKKTESL